MSTEVKTMTSGNLWKVTVKPGGHVQEGDEVFIMEVMKMEVSHPAPVSGTVSEILVPEGTEGLDAEQTVLLIDQD